MIASVAPPSRYRMLETIGRGGMGEVRLADDLLLDRRVALKFLTWPSDDGGGAIGRLLHEARAAAAPDHPNQFPPGEPFG
jgi:serine/threonine-protein kinase